MLKIEVIMENIIYYKGVAVGIECGGSILWFTGAPQEAIEKLGGK